MLYRKVKHVMGHYIYHIRRCDRREQCPEGRGEATADTHLLYALSECEDEGATATEES